MASQSSIDNSSFIDACISEKKTPQDCYEDLGLFSEHGDARKDPVFSKEEANDLHRRIKEVAQSLKAAYRNDREKLLAALIKEDTLAEQVRDLGQLYGRTLWDRPQGVNPDQLNWNDATDQELICFYLRCWITGVAVQSLPPKVKETGKGRANATTKQDISDAEYSGADFVQTPPRTTTVSSSQLPIRAPERPCMPPPAERNRAERTNVQSGPIDVSDTAAASAAKSRPSTTPSKRKTAPHLQGQESSGKLQKVTKETPASTSSPQHRQRNVYSGPVSPALNFPAFLVGQAQRQQRESTCDTDATWAPPEMERVESEAVSDRDDVMGNAQDLLSGVGLGKESLKFNADRSPTAGPSGTYRNPQRQDSVILSPHLNSSRPQSERTPCIFHTAQVDLTNLNEWHIKELRMDLFVLLLSFLNGINQFGATAYDHDADVIRSKVGCTFAELQNAWDHWTNMRHSLAEFQRTTGYFGRSGDGWKEHLRRMERVDHAKASIAFIDMKRAVANEGFASIIATNFNDQLATVFHLLTQVEGCNGVEEFGAVSSYNTELLEWFP